MYTQLFIIGVIVLAIGYLTFLGSSSKGFREGYGCGDAPCGSGMECVSYKWNPYYRCIPSSSPTPPGPSGPPAAGDPCVASNTCPAISPGGDCANDPGETGL